MKKYLFTFFFLLNFAYGDWSLHDVSLLLPLPKIQDKKYLINTSLKRKEGNPLTKEILQELPLLTPRLIEQNRVIENLFVIGIRIDPCFIKKIDSKICSKQIRLIWQPLINNEQSQKVEAIDAAIHSFYDLTDKEFKSLLFDLKSLKKAYPFKNNNRPLTVHPLLSSYGYTTDYWKRLKNIILTYTVEQSLTRVTFMTLEVTHKMWDFGGFEINDDKIKKMIIPKINSSLQSYVNSLPFSGFRGGVRPSINENQYLNSFLRNSLDFTYDRDQELKKISQFFHGVTNPLVHNSATIDCVSCHLSGPVLRWMKEKRSDLNLHHSEYRSQSKLNLQNMTLRKNEFFLLRAFGYQGNRPAINDRAIFETAEVIKKLNSKF